MASIRWPPMESNPEVLNKFSKELGIPEDWGFSDVFGLDPDLLAMIPQPTLSLILLFPSKKKTPVDETKKSDKDVFFLKQVEELDDACGSIALVHAIANNIEKVPLSEDSVIKKYILKMKQASPLDRGLGMASDPSLAQLHSSFAEQGQTQGVPAGQSSNHHFVCFTQIGSELFELDGCKPFPICHGNINDSFLESAAKIIKDNYINDPDVVDFSILAFGKLE